MRQRTKAWIARHGLILPIVAWAVFMLGACADTGGETGEAVEGAETDAAAQTQDPAQAQGQDPVASACWIRGDPADLDGRSSPLDSTEVTLDAGTVKVCYNRPQRRDRTVMGDLVPFGEPWRLGANEATAIYVSAPATIGDVDVEPGWYTLYAVPGENEWQLVVNSATERWGIPIDADVRASDVGSITVPVEQTDAPVEQLTMTLNRTSPNEAALATEWEETRVSVPIRMR